MAVALVAHTFFAGGTGGGTTVTGQNTTGASIILVYTASYQGTGSGTLGSVTDNKSNTYTRRVVLKTSTTGFQEELWECVNPNTGTGHTWTQTGTSSFNSFCVGAWSGVTTTTPFGASSTAQTTIAATSIQPGSLTPTSGALYVTGLLESDGITGTVSVDSGLTITDQTPNAPGTAEGSALAWGTGAGSALNPTWSGFTSAGATAALAAWYTATSGPPPSATGATFAMMGV